jgi:hypothetical protein
MVTIIYPFCFKCLPVYFTPALVCIAPCFSAGWCTFIPSNVCCLPYDNITKVYFDRGLYSKEGIGQRKELCCCIDTEPYCVGTPKAISKAGLCVCCCIDCSPQGSHCMYCHSTSLCGDWVAVQPVQEVCGMQTKAMWACNCCSLCEPKTG